jgi:hypothetical protein
MRVILDNKQYSIAGLQIVAIIVNAIRRTLHQDSG